MNIVRGAGLLLASILLFGATATFAQPAPRQIPARLLPVPDTVSPQLQIVIGKPLPELEHPKSAEEWKALIARKDGPVLAALPSLRKRLGVSVQPSTIAGVKVSIVTPADIPPANRNRLLVHVHGGAYVFNGGEAGTTEAILTAHFARMKVISVDYRMPPDHPYPAGLDDAMAVWKALVKEHDPRRMAIFGTSAGGNLALAMVLRAKKEGLPLPAAVAPGTPWSDITKTGDTYYTNEDVDNLLGSYDGEIGGAAKLYASGHDMKDPLISPVYGDFHGFPPTMLTSGTRDLFLSNTVRVHRKMRAAGVDADLHVFEGASHGQYAIDPSAPESADYFSELVRFLEKHLLT